MSIELNKYVDFKKLFGDLVSEKFEEMRVHQYEADHYKKILAFEFQEENREKFELLKEDCDFDRSDIVFVFYQETSKATESNPNTDGVIVTIIYNRILDEFTSFESE